jgi:hypothetical protein
MDGVPMGRELGRYAFGPLPAAADAGRSGDVLNALLRATTITGSGRTVEAIPIGRVRAVLAKYGRPVPQGSAADK